MEKKIFLDKNDDLNRAVDLLISDSAEKIVLNIPKNSVLGASVHNFQVLERESETAGKELAIESVDEHILELASLATIPAVNPVFKTKERVVADVLPGGLIEEGKPAKKIRSRRKTKEVSKRLEISDRFETEVRVEEPVQEEKPKRGRAKKKKEPVKEEPLAPSETLTVSVSERKSEYEEEIEKPEEKPDKKISRRSRGFWIKTFSTVILIIGLGYLAAVYVLPKATISVSIEKTTASFSNRINVDVKNNAPSVNGDAINLPAQLSVAKNNLSMSFPATGSSTTSMKAGGMLTVFNAYSAQAQTLVANTRFESPEGKIFRLVKKTTVPGAKISNGKITPSSIEAQVIADQSGSDYNVPPSQGWRIPGFKGTPRYDKFYAEAKTSMTGGASGNRIIPTLQDIKEGKRKIEDALRDSLKSQMLILNSPNLKLLNGASVFRITTENIMSQVDKDNNFSIFSAGELRQLVFDENMLKDIILKSVATSTGEVKIDGFSISYSTSTADLDLGKMSFSVSGTVVYEPKTDFDAFKNSVLGLDADTLKTAVFALPGLQRANISFWPFWVNSVPARESRVSIVVE